MQQVAAHKTDIAALPFSASGTAKAVGTGIGTQQQANNENNQAFNRLYQDAKTTKSDFVLNEKEDQVAQSRTANRSDRAAPQSSVSSDTIKNGKDRDAGHTDLPVRDEVTDIPAESEADSHNANQEENATLDAQGSATTTQPSTDGENTNLVIDDAEGAVEQKKRDRRPVCHWRRRQERCRGWRYYLTWHARRKAKQRRWRARLDCLR